MPVSLLSWSSRKIQRKVRSSLGAEASALSGVLERLDFVRVLYGELSGDLDSSLVGYAEYLRATRALSCTDCKSLADALSSTGSAVSHTSDDPRAAIEIAMIKQRLQTRECRFQWIDGAIMIADLLTKGLARGNVPILLNLMSKGVYKVLGSQELLDQKALLREKKAAVKATMKKPASASP